MAVSREQLIFDAFANTSRAEAGFQALGRKAGAASDHVSALAKRLDDISAKSAEARVKLAGDKEALAQLDRLDLKMVTVGRRVMDPKVTIEGAARAAVELAALDVAFDKVGKSAEKAAGDAGKSGLGALAGGGGIPGGGMGALIAAGAALSPVLVTLSFGLAGFGAAAYGVAAPILKAAHAAGGLQANMAKLDPEQRKVAQGLLGLGDQFDAFEKQMKPAVFTVFNQGVRLAGHLMRDVEPVAKATGTALGGMLGQIDAEFQSQTWQQFFGFMARTAGPDIQLLTANFTALLQVLPPLLESLQPLATALLKDTAGLLNLVAATEKAVAEEAKLRVEAESNTGWFGRLAHAAGQAFGELVPGGVGIKHLSDEFSKLGQQSGGATGQVMRAGFAVGDLIHPLGDAARHAGLFADNTGLFAAAARQARVPVFNLAAAVTKLNASMTTLIGNLLTLQGSNVAWRQSMQAAKKQLDSNTAGLAGNSKNALANKQAIIASTNAAITFASEQLTLHKNISGASDTIQKQINFLQGLHDKSAFVRNELKALRAEEQLLNKQRINQIINVAGRGTFSVSELSRSGVGLLPSKPLATGGRVPGYGGGDRFPALLEGGEAVVPKHLTPAVAPFLRAHKVPGFAAGGLVPSYAGNVAGMVPWIRTDDAATLRIIDLAVARAATAAMRAARAAGPGGPATHASMPYLENLWDAAGGPPGIAHLMAAIAMAESGGNANARNPSGASGLWQILGLPFPGNPFNPLTNARMAVAKYLTQGLGAWVTYTSGAYKAYYARGGKVPGYGGGDRWPALLEGGEAVVPKHLTPVLAPFLKAHGVPGFAQGGLAGALAGLTPGSSNLWADVRRLLAQIAAKYTGTERRRLDRIVEEQARDIAEVRRRIRAMDARDAARRAYAKSVTSGLSGFADLSTMTLGGGFVGGKRVSGAGALQQQLGGSLSQLHKFASVLRRLDKLNLPGTLLRQIVALGPGPGTQWGQELLSASPGLLKKIAATERDIGISEHNIGQIAGRDVFGNTSDARLERQFRHERRALVNIERMIVADKTDILAVAQQLSHKITAAGFGS